MNSELPGEEEACFELEETSVSVALLRMNDDEQGGCLTGALPDARLSWRASAAGRYLVTSIGGIREINETAAVSPGETFHLENSAPPTLALRAGDCANDDAPSCSQVAGMEDGSSGRAVVYLEADAWLNVTMEVEADVKVEVDPEDLPHSGVGLEYVGIVQIEKLACGEVALDEATTVEDEQFVDGAGQPFGPVSCQSRPDRSPTEVSYRYVALESGTYVATLRDQYDEPLALARFSTDCAQELDCSLGSEAEPATLSMNLEAGEEVILVGSGANYPDEGYLFLLSVELQP